MFKRIRKEEQGIAMVTAILVSAVVLILSTAVVQLSLHNSDASAYDRNRVQSIHAAEAGVDYYLSLLSATGGQSPPCTLTKTLAGSPGSFTVSPLFYNAGGAPLTCPLDPGVVPATVLLNSVGSSTSGRPRTMQAYAKLTVTQGSTFDNAAAIFGDSSVTLNARTRVGGSQYNDADVYTNGPANLSAGSVIYGSLYAQGAISAGSTAEVKREAWSGSSITLANETRIGGSATSTSTISMGYTSRISGDAKASGAISGGVVDGYRSPNTPGLTAPPSRSYPVFVFKPLDWSAAGYTNQQTFTGATGCSNAVNYIRSTWTGGSLLVRVGAGCTLTFPQKTTINVKGNLAIISDAPVLIQTQTRFAPSPASSTFDVFLFGGLSGTAPCDIRTDSNAGFNPGLTTMFYVPAACGIDLASNTALTQGQLLGGTVTFNASAGFAYRGLTVPGTGVGGFKQDVLYKREVIS